VHGAQALAEIPPDKGRGMCGCLVLCGGEVCPHALPAPFGMGADITGNQVLCASYRLPDLEPHNPIIMPGTELDPPVLTDADMPVVSAARCLRWCGVLMLGTAV
jgi:hypothetical protein